MTPATHETGLPLVLAKDGPRIDSRIVADELGIQHDNLIQNLERYRDKLGLLGFFRFQTEKLTAGRGRPVRFALLNEDQAYFAVTLSRNTEQAVEVKFRLVRAFSEARQQQGARQTQYLPFYHLAHDAARSMAQTAQQRGSEAPEQVFHTNVERLINRVFGIEPGQRASLSPAMRNAVSTAYQLVSAGVADTLADGGDHKAAYREAERRVTDFARLFGPAQPGRLAA